MAFGEAEPAIGSIAAVGADHERADAREVHAERQDEHVGQTAACARRNPRASPADAGVGGRMNFLAIHRPLQAQLDFADRRW